LLAHQICEVLTPGAQHCLIDVKPLPLFAVGFYGLVHVRVLLIGLQYHI